MKKLNQTQFAILGLLHNGPKTGYQIKKEAEESIGNFWSESYGHLYPTLKQLLEKEWIKELKADQANARVRRIYQITKAGKSAFQEWIAMPCEQKQSRDELLLKLFFGSEAQAQVSIEHLEQLVDSLGKRLQLIKGIERSIKTTYANDPGCVYWLITLDHGFKLISAKLDWAKESIKKLKK